LDSQSPTLTIMTSSALPRLTELIPRRQENGPAPLSLMQQRVFFLEEMAPGTTVFNGQATLRLRGKVDPVVLQRSIAVLAERHQPLRTTLRWENGEPVQHVTPELAVDLSPIDLCSLPREEREQELLARVKAVVDLPFDLARGPLVRFQLVRLSDDESALTMVAHHAVWDGSSFDVFKRELGIVYGALARAEPVSLPPLPITYGDFAAWTRERLVAEAAERELPYWKGQLGGELANLELPTDRPRPPTMSYRAGTAALALSPGEVEKLDLLARREGATLFMLMLAAFDVLLHRYTGQTDILVGTPIEGRTRPGTEGLVGCFVNTLVLRADLENNPSFSELLRRVRDVCLDAYAHQEMPLELLLQTLNVPRDPSRTPLYQVLFAFQSRPRRELRLGDVPYDFVDVERASTLTDLSLWVEETTTGVSVTLEYRLDLFDAPTMERFVAQYGKLLASVLEDPTQAIGRIGILPEAERQAIFGVNATEAPYDKELGVHELVARQAREHPERVALEFRGKKLTYGELEERSRRVAARLVEQGVGRDVLVGLFVERSPEMVVAMLGVMKAGGGYVPLDPAFPRERLSFMVQDARLGVLVSQRSLEKELPQHQARVVYVEEAEGPGEPSAELPKSSGEAAAYVIYTSGSTGKPKGVIVPHGAVVNFLQSVSKTPGLGADDTLLAVTTLSFDIAVLELLLPLTVGAKVVLASREEATDGAGLLSLLRESGATALQATPSTWRLLLGAGWKAGDLGTALVGGEALPPDLAEELIQRTKSAWNMYGPTETTVWSTCHALRAGERVLIGRPLSNTRVYVLDGNMEPCPLGVPGELYLGGDGVTRGYLDRRELTAQRFLADPFVAGGRMYRTGDLVRLLSDGNLEYLRRNDNQVKLRGYRIELGEIETSLQKHEAVQQVVALVREDRPGDARLTAYVVKAQGRDATDSELRAHLRGFLPDYMVPQHFVTLPELPLTPNGKVDKKALPPPFASQVDKDVFVAPSTGEERLVADIWKSVLGAPRVSAHDNFFATGGHSLLSLRVIAEIERATGVRLSPRVLLLNSLAQVAAQLAKPPAEGPPSIRRLPSVPPPPPNASVVGRLFRRVKEKIRGA
jgi:amino acid adenylation domain-containing protein